jgi:osmotically-inducible protein OsmY
MNSIVRQIPSAGEAIPTSFETDGENVGLGRTRARIDYEITLEVMNALHWDLAVPRHQVTVSVDEGWVVLRGRVPQAYSKRRAEADARSVPGVIGVTNAIVFGG